MTSLRLLSSVLVPVCWLFLSEPAAGNSAEPGPGPGPGPGAAVTAATNSSGGGNSSQSAGGGHVGPGEGFRVDSSMIQRALYVLIGITVIGVLYFLIRAVRLKRPSQKKKYGLLSNYDDSVEMEAVESEEDDTLYEARSLRR